MKTGDSVEAAKLVEEYIHTFYDVANIPYSYRMSSNGGQIAVLDRRGWLHISVFEAKAEPEDCWRNWSKLISLFSLVDPATSRLFPSPLPRSALPTLPDATLHAVYKGWLTNLTLDVQRRKNQEAVERAMAGLRTPAWGPAGFGVAGMGAGAGTGVGAFGGGGGFSGDGSGFGGGQDVSGGGGGGSDHATTMDTINSVATLGNTMLSLFGGSGGGGGGTGNGLAGLGAFGGTGLGGMGAFGGPGLGDMGAFGGTGFGF